MPVTGKLLYFQKQATSVLFGTAQRMQGPWDPIENYYFWNTVHNTDYLIKCSYQKCCLWGFSLSYTTQNYGWRKNERKHKGSATVTEFDPMVLLVTHHAVTTTSVSSNNKL